jgi:hypothetical protein
LSQLDLSDGSYAMFTIVFSLFYSDSARSAPAIDRARALLIDFCGFGSHNSRVAGHRP